MGNLGFVRTDNVLPAHCQMGYWVGVRTLQAQQANFLWAE